MAEQARTKVAHYLNVLPSGADTWALIGLGVDSLQMAYNPQSDTKQYINQDTATTRVTGYQPNVPVTQLVYPGDDVFDFVDAIRKAGPSIGGNDITEIVEVDLYEDPVDTDTYNAIKWTVQVQIDNGPGGDGGADLGIGYTLNIQGDQTAGYFDVAGLAFSTSLY